jgi:hypothetical protein
MEKVVLKVKNLEKTNKKMERHIKDLQTQLAYMKKKFQNDFHQFISCLISKNHSKRKNTLQQTNSEYISEEDKINMDDILT